jgi:hypothetical protein
MTPIERLRDAMGRLDEVLADPHPGLFTWHVACQQGAEEVLTILTEYSAPTATGKVAEAEGRLDTLFMTAFNTNDDPMLDWVMIKFELKRLRRMEHERANHRRD